MSAKPKKNRSSGKGRRDRDRSSDRSDAAASRSVKSEPSKGNWILPVVIVVVGLGVLAVGVWKSGWRAAVEPTVPVTATSSPAVSTSGIVAIAPASQEIPLPEDLASLELALKERIEALAQAIRDNPTDAEARGRLGLLYDAHDYRDQALECYAQASSADPENPRWRYHWGALKQVRGDAASAESAFRAVLAKLPKHVPSHERLGLLLLDRGIHREAGDHFQQVIRLRPDQPPGYAGMGRVLLAMDRPMDAIPLFQKALSIAPQWGAARYLLGQAYMAVGRSAEAKVQMAQGTGSSWIHVSDPWHAEVAKSAVGRTALLSYAMAFSHAGRAVEAARVYERLLVRDPIDIDAANGLASLHLSAGRAEDAIRVLKEPSQANPKNAQMHITLAASYYESDNVGGSLMHALQAVRLDPALPDAHYGVGIASAALGEMEEAMASLQTAAELEPADPRYQQVLCEFLIYQKSWDEAEPYCRSAAELEPKNWESLFNLGRVCMRLDLLDDAVHQLQAAVALNAPDPRVRRSLERAIARRSSKDDG